MKQAKQSNLYYVYDQEHLTSKQLDEVKKQAYDIAVNSDEGIKNHLSKLKAQNNEGAIWFSNSFVNAYMDAKKRLVADAYAKSVHHTANMAWFRLTLKLFKKGLGYTGYRSAMRQTSDRSR